MTRSEWLSTLVLDCGAGCSRMIWGCEDDRTVVFVVRQVIDRGFDRHTVGRSLLRHRNFPMRTIA